MAPLLLALTAVFAAIHRTDTQTRLIHSKHLLVLAGIRLVALLWAYVSTNLGLNTNTPANEPSFYSLIALLPEAWGLRALLYSIGYGIVLALTLGALASAATHITKREMLGNGDIRLYATCSLFLNTNGIFLMVMLSVLYGLAAGIYSLARHHNHTFAFAPGIVWGCWVAVLLTGR